MSICVSQEILGEKYLTIFGNPKETHISEGNLGECHVYSKEIKVVDDPTYFEENLGDEEVQNRTLEVLAHEIFHAYLNESGIEIDLDIEEQIATFYQKNWKKMSNSILYIFDTYQQTK